MAIMDKTVNSGDFKVTAIPKRQPLVSVNDMFAASFIFLILAHNESFG